MEERTHMATEPNLELEQLPYNLEAEQSVLGGLLLDPSYMAEALKYVSAVSFYREQHQQIFSVIARMYTSGQPIDFVTVYDAVVVEQVFDTPENAKVYLGRLMEIIPSVANLDVYCKIVQEKYYVRSLITAAREIISIATESGADAQTILDTAEQKIYEIRQGRVSSSLVPINEVINREFDHLDKLATGEQKAGISSGFSGLDTILTGLNPSDLILIAARPAMGKTSFALNIAVNAAKRSKRQVAIFSLEMSSQQLVERMLASECRITSTKLHVGELAQEEWALLASGAQELSETQIYLDDTPNINIAEMKSKLRRLPNLGLVVIDYLQLMTTGRRDGNRVQEISEITRNLKIMAKELDVPVISLSQLSRGPESRQDHRPMLADLRESGSIEQDADIVMFLYRDEYYNPEEGKAGIAECIVAKNRHGEVGTIELGWNGQFTRFSGLDTTHYE